MTGQHANAPYYVDDVQHDPYIMSAAGMIGKAFNIECTPESRKRALATAHLFAAAPEALALLRDLEHGLSDMLERHNLRDIETHIPNDTEWLHERIATAQAIIKKAGGFGA